MCGNNNTVSRPSETPVSSLTGTLQFSSPNAFYCCQCGHGPWSCALYAACIECGHHFDPSHCRPAYIGGDNFSFSSSTNSGQKLTVSSPKATTNSSSAIYNNANGLNFNVSPEDLTPPNALVPPPVSHSVCSLDVTHGQSHDNVGGVNPMTVPAADGDDTWYCCSCGTGPFLVAIYPQCMNCHHARCYYCKVE